MNYFLARQAERLFREYKALALEYWEAQPPDNRREWDRTSRPESAESSRLRERINLMFPEVNSLAHELGVAGLTCYSYPAPAVGGPVLPVNLLLSVIDREMGHRTIEVARILDVIHRAIGSAEIVKRRALWRAVVPLYWPIDIVAFIIRIPFLILRKAGVPPKVEENIVSHIIKAILTAVIVALLAYLGLEKHIGDILRFLGR